MKKTINAVIPLILPAVILFLGILGIVGFWRIMDQKTDLRRIAPTIATIAESIQNEEIFEFTNPKYDPSMPVSSNNWVRARIRQDGINMYIAAYDAGTNVIASWIFPREKYRKPKKGYLGTQTQQATPPYDNR